MDSDSVPITRQGDRRPAFPALRSAPGGPRSVRRRTLPKAGGGDRETDFRKWCPYSAAESQQWTRSRAIRGCWWGSVAREFSAARLVPTNRSGQHPPTPFIGNPIAEDLMAKRGTDQNAAIHLYTHERACPEARSARGWGCPMTRGARQRPWISAVSARADSRAA